MQVESLQTKFLKNREGISSLVVSLYNIFSQRVFLMILFVELFLSGIPEFLDSGRWTLDAELWTLDSGRWTLDSGRWTPDAGLWMLDSGPWTRHLGR